MSYLYTGVYAVGPSLNRVITEFVLLITVL